MTFTQILYSVFLGPLELIFDTVFTLVNRAIDNPGLSIAALSLLINLLVLPLYRRADAIQEEERLTELKLKPEVDHIKKTFKGDERMMILQTLYRQNNYKPSYALKSATSLLLQIPFFIAAYRYLSELKLLNGVSFGLISDLSAPDGLLKIGAFSINLLPLVMTAVNLISCVIFTKNGTLKTKIQLYAMALFFMFFLYTSPSGLVFYWTLNNVFSLIKTVLGKLKKSKLKTKEAKSYKSSPKIFISGAVFMTVLTGILIPSAVIASSPQEFVDVTYYYNPLWYIVQSLCTAAGLYIVWMSVFYFLSGEKGKNIFEKTVWIMCGCATVQYMFFGKGTGNLSNTLKYENCLEYTSVQMIINGVVLIAAGLILYFISKYISKITAYALIASSVAFCFMSALNIANIKTSVDKVNVTAEETIPSHTLSKNGRNVVVIMLDRAMGMYVPYIMNELSEVRAQFDGFTYYSNTLSFGTNTNFCSASLYGGYEYTPVELNKRNTESLKDKQNEALKVLPVLFDSYGYSTTVFDPPYANYEWIPDLSIYDEYPSVKAYNTKGVFLDETSKAASRRKTERNFFCYSIIRTAPTSLQPVLYDYGFYNTSRDANEEGVYSGQKAFDTYTASGIDSSFMDSYSVLDSLDSIVTVNDEEKNTFLIMDNETTHGAILLKEPEYTPSQTVDNSEYERTHQDRLTVNGRTLKMENSAQAAHYQTNAAVLIKLGEWFDYLRAEGVYDNTRIILVADHGGYLSQLDELCESGIDGEGFFPLLMVKDFDSEGFTESDEFMTNADVPTLATDGIIENPINPFTGKAISNAEKTAHDQYIIVGGEWDIEKNNGNTFAPCSWVKIRDSIWNKDNWTKIGDSMIIDSYSH